MQKFYFILVFSLLNALISTCEAGFIITIQQVNSDVFATGSGSVNTAGLTYFGQTSGLPALVGNGAVAVLGVTTSTILDEYRSVTGPFSFGSGTATFNPNSGSGDRFGIVGANGTLVVPQNYLSGSSLSATSTWLNQSFSSLGVTPGTYTWNWGSGANADSATVQIGSSNAVPEPGTLPLFLAAALAQFSVRRWRRQGVGRV